MSNDERHSDREVHTTSLGSFVGTNDVVFISYRRPMRSRRTLIHFLGVVAVGLMSASIAMSSPRNANGVPGLIAIIFGLLAIVETVIAFVLLWGMLSGAVHTVEVTDNGIVYDGRQWSWDRVKTIKRRAIKANTVEVLMVAVRTEAFRSQLTLSIQVPVSPSDNVVSKFEEFLREAHPEIQWQ